MIPKIFKLISKFLYAVSLKFKAIIKYVYKKLNYILNIFTKLFYKLELKLRQKLLILFIIIAIPSLLFTVLTFSIITQTVSTQVDSFHKAVVISASKLVEHYILNCQKSLTTLASEKDFRYSVSRRDETLSQRDLKRIFIKHKNFSFLSVVRKKDDKLYTLSSWPNNYENLLKEKAIYKYLELNFSNPQARISEVYNQKGKHEILLVYPMRGALLVGGVNVKNLSDLLNKIKPIEESSFMLLDSGSSFIIGGQGKVTTEFVDNEGSIKFPKFKSKAFYSLNEAIGWRILLNTPYKVIYRSAIYLRVLLFVFVLLGLITAISLAMYFSKMITQPISDLNKGARILGSGNLAYRIDIHTGDELEELADEFNSMGEELKKSYDSLGEKIKNATRDLEDAYSEIEIKNVELSKADRLKSEFLASMSHELRTPMNAIIGFTSLLHDGIYGEVSPKQKDTYEKIMKNTKHLLNLINDILDLSKIEAGRMKLNPETIKLNLLIHDLKEEVRPLVEEKGLELELELSEEIQCVQDYTRLRQVIMNLVSNAVKFTKEGSVTIKTVLKHDDFLVEVIDTGIGIKEEDIKHIFDEFIQADGSITREFGGTGLGLSISKKLINMMGGRLELESKWEQGSTFRLVLPYGNTV